MTGNFTMKLRCSQADIRWLTRLLRAVPLAQGRMDIRANWLTILVRCGLFVGLAAVLWAMSVTAVMTWESGQELFQPVIVAIATLLVTAGAVEYTRRMGQVLKRKPDFTLSPQGLSKDGALLAWTEVADIEYLVEGHPGGVTTHACRLHLSNGDKRRLELDHLDISQRRVMMLVDFYWSGAKPDLPPWHWKKRYDPPGADLPSAPSIPGN